MLDIVDAIDLIDHLVEIEGRDYQAHCAYVSQDEEEPSCLVGRAWSIAGATVGQLKELHGESPRRLWRRGKLPIEMTFGAAEVFDAAQRAQDRRDLDDVGTWGEAQDAAHEVAVKIAVLFSERFATVEEKVLVSA